MNVQMEMKTPYVLMTQHNKICGLPYEWCDSTLGLYTTLMVIIRDCRACLLIISTHFSLIQFTSEIFLTPLSKRGVTLL